MTQNWLQQRWKGPGGIQQLLMVSFPLILSYGTSTIQMFVDRMFLGHHNLDEMAAASPASITAFLYVSLFMGTGGYVNTFVAQYTGAGQPHRIGPAVWQGIYLSFIAALFSFPLIRLAEPIFDFYGHAPAIRQYEIEYFQIMCFGAGPSVLAATMSSFYTGRGKTWTILYVNILATAVNIVLDWVMIFGNLGFPEMGIAGAAWATVIAHCVNAAIYVFLHFRKINRTLYATHYARFNRDLFGRLIRYGLPHGIQFMLEMLGFTLFIALVGRLGSEALAATNITFQLNMFAFLPMLGSGIALTALVGQALGQNDIALARRTTWNAFLMTYAYMGVIALSFILWPEHLASVFRSKGNEAEYAALIPAIRILVRFVAFYCLFDTCTIIFSAVLKGAGDTRYVMVVSVIMSWLIMVIPSYLIIDNQWGGPYALYLAWCCATAYICSLAIMFSLRYRTGKWTKMRVIEMTTAEID